MVKLKNNNTSLARKALRVWQEIAERPYPTAVFLFQAGLHQVVVDSPGKQRQLDQLLEDIPHRFIGLFNRDGDYREFMADMVFTETQLKGKYDQF